MLIRDQMTEPLQHSPCKSSQILDAAIAEFLENGFADASMDRISSRAGVSKRTVYKHFESKENLFRELIRKHWEQFEETLDVTYDKDRDIRDQLMGLAEAEGKLMTSTEVMLTTRLVMSEILRRPDLVEQNQEKTNYTSAFETMLREASEDGKLRVEDPRSAAEEFLALVKGKAFWPVVFGAPVVPREEMEKIVRNSVDMMMSRYGVN